MSDLDHEPPLDAVEPDVEAPEAEAPEPPEYAPEVVEQARKYGWKAPDEWKGDAPPKGFMAPTDYLELPGVQNKILRDEMAELRKAQEARDRETADKLSRMDRMYEEAARRRAEAHKAEVERLKAEQRKAVESGDTETFEALEKRREELGPAPQQEKPQQTDAEVETIQKWVGALPADHWWKQDPVLRTVSGALYDEAGAKGVMGADAKLAYVERRIREEMPHKFPKEQKRTGQTTPRVDGGGLGLGGKAKLSEKLPPEAKAAGDRFVKDGLFKDLDDYAKTYFEQEGA